MHEAANGEMRHHQTEEFLPDQFRRLAAQHDLGAADVGLQFIQRGFDLPALMIERRQFLGVRHRGIENGGDQTIVGSASATPCSRYSMTRTFTPLVLRRRSLSEG